MTHTLLLIAIFWAIFFGVSFTLHCIYEYGTFEIKPWSYFDTYPFKCKRCMTTWALISTYIMAGILLADTTFTLFGITLAALYGYGMYKNDKERIIGDD